MISFYLKLIFLSLIYKLFLRLNFYKYLNIIKSNLFINFKYTLNKIFFFLISNISYLILFTYERNRINRKY
jgi:hypothetical protein